MQRLLAVLLVLIGLTGLVLGRLGETIWAPETETTATVDLSDAGPAVVIDPGVLYVGGDEGELVIEGASDVSVITAGNSDIEAYLEDIHYTRVTGASDWTTLGTQEVNPDGADELSEPTTSDLWRTVDTKPSPYTLDVHEFWAGENNEPNGEENEQPYRALLIVTDGTQPGAEKVSITWPVDAENEWVPFAYAGGAAIAVIGLVLLVVSLGGRRRDRDEDELVEDARRDSSDAPVDGVPAADDSVDSTPADDSRTETGTPASDDRTEQIDVVDDEGGQR
ncbi:MAG: hypothetical protein ACTHV2_05585 [Brachybacterium sp.]|uniref:hypothetical protein n=1 Tax=Brachybacterium sp. TaxID=1891286 RepID=UPI003F8F2F04